MPVCILVQKSSINPSLFIVPLILHVSRSDAVPCSIVLFFAGAEESTLTHATSFTARRLDLMVRQAGSEDLHTRIPTGSRNVFECYSLSQNANASCLLSARDCRLHCCAVLYSTYFSTDRHGISVPESTAEWELAPDDHMRSSRLLVSLPFPVSMPPSSSFTTDRWLTHPIWSFPATFAIRGQVMKEAKGNTCRRLGRYIGWKLYLARLPFGDCNSPDGARQFQFLSLQHMASSTNRFRRG